MQHYTGINASELIRNLDGPESNEPTMQSLNAEALRLSDLCCLETLKVLVHRFQLVH